MNNIAIVRDRAGITQAALYTKLNWRQSRLSNYENNIRPLKLADARQIVCALNSLGAKTTLDEVFPIEKKKSLAG